MRGPYPQASNVMPAFLAHTSHLTYFKMWLQLTACMHVQVRLSCVRPSLKVSSKLLWMLRHNSCYRWRSLRCMKNILTYVRDDYKHIFPRFRFVGIAWGTILRARASYLRQRIPLDALCKYASFILRFLANSIRDFLMLDVKYFQHCIVTDADLEHQGRYTRCAQIKDIMERTICIWLMSCIRN